MSVLNVRLPASLQEELRQVAQEEQVSMNQMVLLAVAEKLAARRILRLRPAVPSALDNSLRARQAGGKKPRAQVRAELLALMESRADQAPLEGDELPAELVSA